MNPLYSKLIWAFGVGSIGSAAYITALYFKFIGDTDNNRKIVIGPFMKRYREDVSFWKCVWYCCVGGFIAVIFQFDVPNFVAVQCLILGATWPAIVSQFLSGRMANPHPKEIEDLLKRTAPTDTEKVFQSIQSLRDRIANSIKK
jgi:hypothetical protein